MSRGTVVVILTGLALGVVSAFADRPDVKYVAHQGEEFYAPGHSAPAYRFAVEHRLDILKMDLRETKDGRIVLSHDDDLKASMNLDWRIKEHTLAEIKGKGRFRPRGGFTNETIQTLEEGLEYAKRMPEIWLDFKDFSPAMAEKVLAAVAKAGISRDRVMVATWTTKALEYIAQKHPDIRRVAHTFVRPPERGWETNHAKGKKFKSEDEAVEAILAEKKRLGLYGFNMPHIIRRGGVLYHTTSSMVAKLKAAGAWVSIWFVYDAETGEYYRKAGADCFVTNAKANTRPPMPRRGICAHQGDNRTFPGNTAEALRSAAEKGAQMVEFDVQECKSGEGVLMHDDTIENLTTGTGRIRDWTLFELKKFEVGTRRKFKGIRIPTFDEALDALPREGIWINVHVYGTPAFLRRIAERIRDRGRMHQAFVCSSLGGIKAARAAVPGILACNIDRPGPRDRPWTAEENAKFAGDTIANGCQFLQLCRPWPREYSDRIHAAGGFVSHFKSNDPNELMSLFAAGIDFVFTDNLDAMLATFRRTSPLSAKPLCDAVFDDDFCDWKTENYCKRLSFDLPRDLLGKSALRVSGPKVNGDTAWALRSPVFPVRPGSGFILSANAAGTVDMRTPSGETSASYIEWLDGEGRPIGDWFTFGLDLKPDGWTVTTTGGDVPPNAKKAFISIGADHPNMETNDFVAIARVTFWEASSVATEENCVTLRDDGMTLVGGKPFFPIGIYGVTKREFNGNDIRRAFRDLKAAGFNFVHTYDTRRGRDFTDFLDAADESGVKVWISPGVNSHAFDESNIMNERGRPSLLAWYLGDDSASHIKPEEMLRRHMRCKALDPAHITVQADFLGQSRSHRYRPFVNCTDAFLPEIYPVSATNRTGREVADVIRHMGTVHNAIASEGNPVKSVWAIIQHFDGWKVWKRFPDMDELRAMTYVAIIHGANGITWYTYGGNGVNGRGVTSAPEHWREICAIAGELFTNHDDLAGRNAKIQPTVKILSGPETDICGFGSISVLMKESGLLMAVNSSTNAIAAEISIDGLRGVERRFDAGPMNLFAGKGFVDEFKPYGTHVYRVAMAQGDKK